MNRRVSEFGANSDSPLPHECADPKTRLAHCVERAAVGSDGAKHASCSCRRSAANASHAIAPIAARPWQHHADVSRTAMLRRSCQPSRHSPAVLACARRSVIARAHCCGPLYSPRSHGNWCIERALRSTAFDTSKAIRCNEFSDSDTLPSGPRASKRTLSQPVSEPRGFVATCRSKPSGQRDAARQSRAHPIDRRQRAAGTRAARQRKASI